jgi:hypothetical protein
MSHELHRLAMRRLHWAAFVEDCLFRAALGSALFGWLP